MNLSDGVDVKRFLDTFCEEYMTNVVEKLEPITEQKFHLILDDPSGYSTIENLHLPYPDPKLEIRYYGRTKEQNERLGVEHNEEQTTINTDLASGDGETSDRRTLSVKFIFRWFEH